MYLRFAKQIKGKKMDPAGFAACAPEAQQRGNLRSSVFIPRRTLGIFAARTTLAIFEKQYGTCSICNQSKRICEFLLRLVYFISVL